MPYNKEYARTYREKHKQERKEYHKKYMQEYRKRPYVRRYFYNYYRKHGDQIRQRSCDISRFKLYGITREQYVRLSREQNHRCFICGRLERKGFSLGVDHDHKTKSIRVLLCLGCNRMAGRIESIGWQSVKNYGERFLNGNRN